MGNFQRFNEQGKEINDYCKTYLKRTCSNGGWFLYDGNQKKFKDRGTISKCSYTNKRVKTKIFSVLYPLFQKDERFVESDFSIYVKAVLR